MKSPDILSRRARSRNPRQEFHRTTLPFNLSGLSAAILDLSTLTDDTPAALTIVARDVAAGARVWAKVGQASSVAGVGGLLTVRYVELP